MLNFTNLQLFLLFNAFVVGILISIAITHIIAHIRQKHQDVSEEPHVVIKKPQKDRLPAEVRQKLLLLAQTKYQTVLNRSVSDLQKNLDTTSEQINKKLNKFGSEIVESEMKRYRSTIDKLRQGTESEIGGAKLEISKHQSDINAELQKRKAELEQKLEADIKSKKDQLLSQLDTKLADGVTSFLAETLQHNIDLGAQSSYLIAMLEEHKNELKKDIEHEA